MSNLIQTKPLWNLPHSVMNEGIHHKLKVIEIPFMGFYDSIWDYVWESEFDNDCAEEDAERLDSDSVNWPVYYTRLAAQIVDWIRHKSGLMLSFEKLTSPREYNFESDRIFAYISETQLEMIYKNIDEDKLAAVFKDNLTPHSGFTPYYDVESWQEPVLTWEYSQTALLMGLYLSELLGEYWERDAYEDLSETARNLLWECKQ